MQPFNFDALMKLNSAVSANKKINRENASEEFLALLCQQTAKDIVPKDLENREFIVQIWAKELAAKMKKQGNLTEVTKK